MRMHRPRSAHNPARTEGTEGPGIEVRVVDPETLPRSVGTLQRMTDDRHGA